MKNVIVSGFCVKEMVSGVIMDIIEMEYNVEIYLFEEYMIVDMIEVENSEFVEVSVCDFILKGDKVFVVVVKKFDKMDKIVILKLICLQKEVEKNNVFLVFIMNVDEVLIKVFCVKYGFYVLIFINDEIELKVILCLNLCLMVVKKGVVVGKYMNKFIFDFKWIQKNFFLKK